MRRHGSNSRYFRERIPSDVRDQLRGQRLAISLGQETVSIVVSLKAEEIKFSLRTSDDREAKCRQALASAQLGVDLQITAFDNAVGAGP